MDNIQHPWWHFLFTKWIGTEFTYDSFDQTHYYYCKKCKKPFKEEEKYG